MRHELAFRIRGGGKVKMATASRALCLLGALEFLSPDRECAQGSPERIQIVRELAIGGSPAGPEYELDGIGHAAVASSGSVFVTVRDGRSMAIRKFDSQGRFRGTIGRMGSAPGEYRSILGLGVSGDSILIVLDYGNGRVVVFDTAGTYRRSIPVLASNYPVDNLVLHTDGTFAVRSRIGRVLDDAPEEVPTAFIRFRPDGQVVDSLRVPPMVRGSRMLLDASLGIRVPFTRATVYTVLSQGGLATALSTNYRIDVRPTQGRPYVIERQATPIPLEGTERSEWQTVLEQNPPAPELPRNKPFIRELLSDRTGRIWVGLYTRGAPMEDPGTLPGGRRALLSIVEHNAYDIYDPGGRYRGRLDLPALSRLVSIADNRIWVVSQTDEGGFQLVRYRLLIP